MGRVRIKEINFSQLEPSANRQSPSPHNLTPLTSQFGPKEQTAAPRKRAFNNFATDELSTTMLRYLRIPSRPVSVLVSEHQFDRSYMNLYGHFPVVNISSWAMQ